jgi:hypothetical protein
MGGGSFTDNEGRVYDEGWTLQERAKGRELYPFGYSHDLHLDGSISDDAGLQARYDAYKETLKTYQNDLSIYASASQDQIDKFVHDLFMIQHSEHLRVDPSKTTNFFYDEEAGFSFIDINYYDEPRESDSDSVFDVFLLLLNRVPTIQGLSTDEKYIGIEGDDAMKLGAEYADLTSKIKNALEKEGFSEDEIDDVCCKHMYDRSAQSVKEAAEVKRSNQQIFELLQVINQRAKEELKRRSEEVINWDDPSIWD